MPNFRLIQRKERMGFTLWGWLVVALAIVLILVVFCVGVYPFLAETRPVNADILVVEGWLPDYALQDAMEEFESQDYRLLVTTGTPLTSGSFLSEYKTCPAIAYATLKKLGFDETRMVPVSAPAVKKDRTYASACALKKWLQTTQALPVKAVNICSFGPHARRSRLLYEKALGENLAVGIIALKSQEYVPSSWWKSSNGVRTVISETIAYIYARVFFHPSGCRNIEAVQRGS